MSETFKIPRLNKTFQSPYFDLSDFRRVVDCINENCRNGKIVDHYFSCSVGGYTTRLKKCPDCNKRKAD